MKIYATNSGSYSDYRIVGLFSSEAKARAAMEAFPKEDWNDIEEYIVDECSKEIARGLKFYRVRMYKNGDVIEVDSEPGAYSLADTGTVVHWMDRAYFNPTQPWTNFHVWAKDNAHAIKIANERRIIALATANPEANAK